MGDSTLYDDDVLLWSEQQAAAIRKLRHMPGLPGELDIEQIAEELERIGRSELAAVRSSLRRYVLYLLKLQSDVDEAGGGRLRHDIAGIRDEIADRYAPSMRRRIEMDDVWRAVRDRLRVDGSMTAAAVDALPGQCPLSLDDLLDGEADMDGLAARMHSDAGGEGPGDEGIG